MEQLRALESALEVIRTAEEAATRAVEDLPEVHAARAALTAAEAVARWRGDSSLARCMAQLGQQHVVALRMMRKELASVTAVFRAGLGPEAKRGSHEPPTTSRPAGT